MDELPERLSVAEMLRAALVALLGQATVLVKMRCGGATAGGLLCH